MPIIGGVNLTPEKLRRTRDILRITQIVLVVILVAAIWVSPHIAPWQKFAAIVLGVFLLRPHLREFASRRAKKD
jgi:hypothetical protein